MLLHFFAVLIVSRSYSLAEQAQPQQAGQSVGKLRSQADDLFSKGQIDESLKIWAEVNTQIHFLLHILNEPLIG
jgi:hypothetical protein